MSGIRSSEQPWKVFPIHLGEGIKIVAMGLLLAICLFVFFFHNPSQPPATQPANTIYEATSTVPALDPAIMAIAVDETRQDRLVLEPEPFKHVLEASLDVVPSVARQLGMPDDPLDPEALQSNPDLYRGRFLWAEGKLLDVSAPIEGHPVEGYDYYEGRLETESGEIVRFAFSLPPEEGIAIGEWVRMEGFFLKLRDSHFPELEMAPMLVGRHLSRSYSAWDPITVLDPAVMASVMDGDFRGGSFYEGVHSNLTLEEYQDVPLWHLASYAIAHKDDMDLEGWRKIEPFNRPDQYTAIMQGVIRKGTPMRILGEARYARVFEADVNPIGVKAWSEVWVQIHDLGGRLVPVWVPERVSFKGLLPVEVRGYLFMRHAYESRDSDRRVTPVFVAATLDRYVTTNHPMIARVGLILAGIVGLLIVIFFLMARRDRISRTQHEVAMVERRRRRRARMTAAATSGPE